MSGGLDSATVRDPFARQALWKDGLGESSSFPRLGLIFTSFQTSSHGTGHGVGHFLNVHEGPQGMGVRIAYNDTELKAGMTLSNGQSPYFLWCSR